MSELHIPRVAILASGEGSTADAYAEAIHRGQVAHEIGLVITDNPMSGIIDKAEAWNQSFGFDTQTLLINGETHPKGKQPHGQTLAEAEAICRELDQHRIGTVALLGYLRIVNGSLIEHYGYLPDEYRSKWQARMVNSHPGPLPETAGSFKLNTSQRVLDLGLTSSRHTVHVVSQGVDSGPIIAEHHVPVLESDTSVSLNERTQWIEKTTIPYAIDMFIRRRADYLRMSGLYNQKCVTYIAEHDRDDVAIITKNNMKRFEDEFDYPTGMGLRTFNAIGRSLLDSPREDYLAFDRDNPDLRGIRASHVRELLESWRFEGTPSGFGRLSLVFFEDFCRELFNGSTSERQALSIS